MRAAKPREHHQESLQDNLFDNKKSMTETPLNEPKETAWHPNRSYLTLSNGLILDSCFPGGNLASASIIANSPLAI
jgi:hypothetical protein